MINSVNNNFIKTQNQIKICIISHFGYPLYNKKCRESFGGGAEVQLYLLSKEFIKEKNLNVNVITGNYKINKNQIELFSNIKIFKILPIKSTIFNYLKATVILFLTLIRMAPDVVIQRGGDIITGFSAFYCKLFKKKLIFSIAHKNDVIKRGKPTYKKFFYIFGLINADFIIAQNNDQISLLENWRNRKIKNIMVINSGYKIQNLENDKKKFILWVARAEKWKRPEFFLKLAKNFPNQAFIMICNKGADKNYWKTIYKSASKITNLKFLEFIPFHMVNQYFKESKIFINTSINEGFPNTFIQAAKNKTPIISLSVNPDNILIKYKIGYFCDNSFKKMDYYLKSLLRNKDLYESYSTNAFIYAIENHNMDKTIVKWINLFKKILIK